MTTPACETVPLDTVRQYHRMLQEPDAHLAPERDCPHLRSRFIRFRLAVFPLDPFSHSSFMDVPRCPYRGTFADCSAAHATCVGQRHPKRPDPADWQSNRQKSPD